MTRRIIFVTGGAGFIGSNIVARMAEDQNLDLVVCDRLREAELGKWRNISKHPIGDFVPPEEMFDWLEKRWRDVEVVSRADGSPYLRLHGHAEQRFRELAGTAIHVSLTHSRTTAVAVVIVER